MTQENCHQKKELAKKKIENKDRPIVIFWVFLVFSPAFNLREERVGEEEIRKQLGLSQRRLGLSQRFFLWRRRSS